MDNMEQLETFYAHNIPEIISGLAVPLCMEILLAILDIRVAGIMLIPVVLFILVGILMIIVQMKKMDEFNQAFADVSVKTVEYVKRYERTEDICRRRIHLWPPVRKHPHLQHRCNRVVPKLLEICCFQSCRLKQQPCVLVSTCRFDVPLRQRDSGQLYYVSVYGACHADSVGNCF